MHCISSAHAPSFAHPCQTRPGILLTTYAAAQSAGFDNANAVPAIKMQKCEMSTMTIRSDRQITQAGSAEYSSTAGSRPNAAIHPSDVIAKKMTQEERCHVNHCQQYKERLCLNSTEVTQQ